MRARTAKRLTFLAGALALLTTAAPVEAQAPEDVQTAFLQWAQKSLHAVSNADLDASTKDLVPIGRMIGDAKIVGLSEGQHAAAEPLVFRNRLFKYLVENLGFGAIAIESGIVESRVLNDYVTQGKGELDTVLEQGFSTGFDTFRQNVELIHWLRNYNARLPPGAAKVQIYGLDVSGGPGNFDAARGPDTALDVALSYLRGVDPQVAAELQRRVAAFLPALKSTRLRTSAAIRSRRPHRDDCRLGLSHGTATVRLYRQEFKRGIRVGRASGHRSTPNRRMVSPHANGMEIGRWIRVDAGGHRRSKPTDAGQLGVDAQRAWSARTCEIVYCSANPRRVMPLKEPPAAAVELLFASVNVPRYVIDLRRAPPRVSSWLRQPHDHWNGFASARFPTAAAFDVAYFVSPITSACVTN
jgi:hypothetical protein